MKRSQAILLVAAFALLLVSVSSALVVSPTANLVVTDTDYSGVTLKFSSNAKEVGVTLTGVNVLTAPLYIQGKDSDAASTDAGVIFTYSSGSLRQPVELGSLLPSNSILSFSGLYASMPAKTSAFIFRSTSLLFNTTVKFTSITATWDTRDASASLVEANTVFSIQQRSAVYITNSVVSKSAHVFAASLSSTLGIKNYGVLAIDYATCTSCSSSLVLIDALLYVSSNSMFRVSNSGSGANALLDHEGDVTITDASLYLLSNVTTSGGKLYSGAGLLSTSTDSTATLSNVTCASSGFTSSSPITVTYVYDLTINKVLMTSAATCLTNGVSVSSAYFSQAAQCTKAQCIPGTTLSATSTSNVCSCNCKTGFNKIACTASKDPLDAYVTSSTSSCGVANCKRCSSSRLGWCSECVCPFRLHDGVCSVSGTSEPHCDSHYDNGFCKKCSTGYQLTDDYRCVLCTTGNCLKCYDNNLCSVCASGYSAGNNGVCYAL